MELEKDSKRVYKRIAMFLMGFNMLQPILLLFTGSYYAVVRFGYTRESIGIFINRTNITLTYAGGLSVILLSIYILWLSPMFGLCKYDHYLAITSAWLALVADCLLLVAYYYGGETGNITYYYAAFVLSAIPLGANQVFCAIVDPKNIPFCAFGIPASELRVFVYHVLFRFIASKYQVKNVDFKLVFWQIIISIIFYFLSALLWTWCHYDKNSGPEKTVIKIERTSDYTYKLGNKNIIIYVSEQSAVEGFRKYVHSVEEDIPLKISDISNKDVHIGDISTPNGIFRGATVYTSGSGGTMLLVELCTECKLDKKLVVFVYDYFFFNVLVSKWYGYRINEGEEMDNNTLSIILTRLQVGMLNKIPQDILETLEPTNVNKNFWSACTRSASFMFMFGLSIGSLYAFYPAIVPYKLIDPDNGYYIDLINMFIRTLPALANCIICNMKSLRKISPQCDWRERKGWLFSWLIFLPITSVVIIAILVLHYPNWKFSKIIKDHLYIVGAMAIAFGFCYSVGRSLGITAIPYQKSTNVDELTGKPMKNVHTMNTKLMCACMTLTYICIVITSIIGNGYHKAYSKYEHDNWPTKDFKFWNALSFWLSEAVKDGIKIVGKSFTTELTKQK